MTLFGSERDWKVCPAKTAGAHLLSFPAGGPVSYGIHIYTSEAVYSLLFVIKRRFSVA